MLCKQTISPMLDDVPGAGRHRFSIALNLLPMAEQMDVSAAPSCTGTCACGTITWTAFDPPSHLDYCYCLTCQRISGAPFQAWMGIAKRGILWEYKYEPFTYRSTVGDTGICVGERTCCSVCGSNISLQYHLYPEKLHIAASTMKTNGFEVPKVGCHIWTKHVPAWYTLPEDGVQRYETFDPEFQAKLDKFLACEQSKASNPGGWWAGMLPGAPDYKETVPDDPTMNDLSDEQSVKVHGSNLAHADPVKLGI